jgi:hypothetical protein
MTKCGERNRKKQLHQLGGEPRQQLAGERAREPMHQSARENCSSWRGKGCISQRRIETDFEAGGGQIHIQIEWQIHIQIPTQIHTQIHGCLAFDSLAVAKEEPDQKVRASVQQ